MPARTNESGAFGGIPRSLELLTNWLQSRGPGAHILSRNELSHTQFIMLRHLLWNPQSSVSRLAADMHISRPAVTQTVDRLVRQGLVSRLEHRHDRRRLEVALTAGGRRIVRRVMRALEKEIEGILAGMTTEDRAALARGVDAFLGAALADVETVQGLCLMCGGDHDAQCPVNLAGMRLAGRSAPELKADGRPGCATPGRETKGREDPQCV